MECEDGKISHIKPPLIWYSCKGDEIAWDGEHYLSLLSEGYFSSLEEMDKFWDDYFDAVSGQQWIIK